MAAPSRTQQVALLALVLLVAEAATERAVKASHLQFNYTNSVPIGLYRETTAGEGTYAGFCLPAAVAQRAVAAGLEVVSGDCPNRLAPILKPLTEATTEHPVTLTARGFLINGRLLPNTAPKAHSHTGAALGHYPFATHATGLWAISSFNPDSYDSRYFGPVDPSAIRFHAKSIWTK